MIEFALAFTGAFLGAIAGAIIVIKLRKVEAAAPPNAPIKKVLRPFAKSEEPLFGNAVHDWLWGKKEE